MMKKHEEIIHSPPTLSRRGFLRTGALAGAGGALATGTLGASALKSSAQYANNQPHHPATGHAESHAMAVVGQIAKEQQPIDPMHFLTAFNKTEFAQRLPGGFYRKSKLVHGQTLHEFLFVAEDRNIEILPGVYFPAWTYNGQVPGPTLRATEGDRVRIWFINQSEGHPHTIHFHGWHSVQQDGALEHQFVYPIHDARQKFDLPFGPGADPKPWLAMDRTHMRRNGYDIYEFDAYPVGLHLYHCHSMPLKRHIHKGLYGTFIVDPIGGRPVIDPDTNEPLAPDHRVHEMVMVMNGFDTNFDGDNEIYAVNSVGFHYMMNPIRVRIGDVLRIFLVNITEFDPINSFHLHAAFFRVYRTGTNLISHEYTDTAMFCQAERAVLEFRFREGWPGKYMFHAHQSEFAELGWMAFFDAQSEVLA